MRAGRGKKKRRDDENGGTACGTIREGERVTKREKLIERMRARPVEAEFNDVKALLEAFGWTHDRTNGSHHTFNKDDERSLTVSTVSGRKVKRYQIDQVCVRLGLDQEP